MHRRADRYRSIAIVKGYRTVKILWPTDECRKSGRLYKWENRAIFSHFWRNLLAASTTALYGNLPFRPHHTVVYEGLYGRSLVVHRGRPPKLVGRPIRTWKNCPPTFSTGQGVLSEYCLAPPHHQGEAPQRGVGRYRAMRTQ